MPNCNIVYYDEFKEIWCVKVPLTGQKYYVEGEAEAQEMDRLLDMGMHF